MWVRKGRGHTKGVETDAEAPPTGGFQCSRNPPHCENSTHVQNRHCEHKSTCHLLNLYTVLLNNALAL